MISAGNDYSKALQFRALETAAKLDEKTFVLREGSKVQVHPGELVVGDILILSPGDVIPADAILVEDKMVYSNESSLTGETEDVMKSMKGLPESEGGGDCFLISSCVVTSGEESRAMVIAVGAKSQWGILKNTMNIEIPQTPLQEKLAIITSQVVDEILKNLGI